MNKKYDKIDSSLNEIDIEIGNILLKQMRIADTRTVAENSDKLLWDSDRICLVDDLTTEEIFNSYLISNRKKEIDITYPILGYKCNDISQVFYGTGNRIGQWEFITDSKDDPFKTGDEVFIISGPYAGNKGIIVRHLSNNNVVVISGTIKSELQLPLSSLRKQSPKYEAQSFKAKQIITSYDVGILTELKKEARYLQDKFILRCADGQIWHPYISKIVKDTEFHIFTVFDIPNIDRYPKYADKLKGEGYIYGITFKVNVWAYLSDEPVPAGFIENIALNINTNNTINKISIN